jgi:hypothetical protein
LEPSIFNLAFHFFMALVLIFPVYFICHTALRIVLSLGTSTLFIRKKNPFLIQYFFLHCIDEL